MSTAAHSRRDFLVGAAKAAALGVSGTAALSGVSAFATSPVRSSATSAAAANAVRQGWIGTTANENP
jgi:endo-1,4-beta-xylanase